MIKFNWGTGIFIFIVLFFIGIFAFLYVAFDNDIELVEKDYYPKELKYQERINKQDNLQQLGEQVRIIKEDQWIKLEFPQSQKSDTITGQILLYRPSNSKLDQQIRIQLDSNNIHSMNTKELIPGKYLLKIAWSYQEVAYYQELILIY